MSVECDPLATCLQCCWVLYVVESCMLLSLVELHVSNVVELHVSLWSVVELHVLYVVECCTHEWPNTCVEWEHVMLETCNIWKICNKLCMSHVSDVGACCIHECNTRWCVLHACVEWELYKRDVIFDSSFPCAVSFPCAMSFLCDLFPSNIILFNSCFQFQMILETCHMGKTCHMAKHGTWQRHGTRKRRII